MEQLISEILKKRKSFQMNSVGSSMMPILLSGDTLFLKKIPFSKLVTDDLILIKKRNKFIIHRIIYKKEKYVITKGDRNISSDGRINPEQIYGKVIQVKRNGQIINIDDLYLYQSTQYFHEILKIKKFFDDQKIIFVFLKGLPLHLYIDKAHPRRIYADCDLLISPKDFAMVKRIMNENNYIEKNTALSSIHRKLKNKTAEVSYYKIVNSIPIVFDIHLEVYFEIEQLGKMEALYPQNLINQITRQFISERQNITINEQELSILSAQNLIVYLALHFFNHKYRGTFRLEFLDKVIRKYPIRNYESEITNMITHYKLNNFIYPVFLLLKKYYSTPLPEKFVDCIKPDKGKIKYIKSNILSINIFDDETRIAAGVVRFKNLFFLSPNPLWRRLMIVFNLQVIYSVFWVIIFFFRRSVIRSWKSFSARFSVIP